MKKKETTVSKALQEAVENHRKRNFSAADRLYTAILKQYPDHPDALHNLGLLALEIGDKIHDVGAKSVLKAKGDLKRIFNHWENKGQFQGQIQRVSGRNWRLGDFHASQLRVIYDLFNDEIVDQFLSGAIDQNVPKLFSCLE